MNMKYIRSRSILIALGLLECGLPLRASAQSMLDVETSYVIPGYNDVAVPGDSGTRFSLTDDLHSDATFAARFRFGHTFAGRHWVAILVAPLTVESDGMLDRDVNFNGEHFPSGTPVDATFRFDSYRLIYRYFFSKSDVWQFGIGGAMKIRDAAIRVKGGGIESEKENTGAVPLLSFNAMWTPVKNWSLVVDGEALAAPQGRAEDVLFAAQYDVSQNVAIRGGYRILEGGADNDEVYTFSLFNYFSIGAMFSF